MDHARPFAGVKVCDIAQGIAAPYCGLMLAQYGADVVKIEGLDGDWVRNMGGRIQGDHSAQSLATNRGKRSLALNLKDPRGLEIARRLAREADVVTQSFRPGVIERLGLGYDVVRQDNPDVIYLAVSGFGQSGPYSKRPATDAILQGFSGLQSITQDSNGTPQRVGMAIIDYITGLYAFQAVAVALHAKLAGGGGRYLDVSLMSSAIAVQAGQFIRHHIQGGQPPANGVPVGTFRTRNGFINLSANRPDHFARVCDALGLEDLKNDPRYDTHDKRLRASSDINEVFQKSLGDRTSEEWVSFFEDLGLMCVKVNEYGDVLEDEHVKAVGTFTWAEQPGLGPIPVPNPPGPAPLDPQEDRALSPVIGQHSHEILAEMGYSETDRAALADAGVIPPRE